MGKRQIELVKYSVAQNTGTVKTIIVITIAGSRR